MGKNHFGDFNTARARTGSSQIPMNDFTSPKAKSSSFSGGKLYSVHKNCVLCHTCDVNACACSFHCIVEMINC